MPDTYPPVTHVAPSLFLECAGGLRKQPQPVRRKLQQPLRKLSVPGGKQSMRNVRAWKMKRHNL